MATNPSVTISPAPLTLPNVIHFLQTESSRYERDRNYWELERAEMKARIAKLEGERKSNERMKDWYLRRLRMLEVALQEERLKIDPNTKPLPPLVAGNEHTGKKPKFGRVNRNEHDETYMGMIQSSQSALHDQAGRNKSRAYLEKCLTEVTYLVNAHPAISANKLVSPPSPFETRSGSPMHSIPGPRPMRDSTAIEANEPERQVPSAQSNGHFSTSDTNGLHLISSRANVDEIDESADLTNDDEPVVRIQHIFDSQGNFVEPLRTYPSSGSDAAGAATNTSIPEAGSDSDWDFEEDDSSKLEESQTRVLSAGEVVQIFSSRVKTMATLQTEEDRWTASIGGSSDIYIHRNDVSEPFLKFHGHEGAIHSLVFRQGDDAQTVTLYSAGEDMVIRKWVFSAESATKESMKITPSVTFISHSQTIRDLIIVGTDLISCSDDASARRWDTKTGNSKRVWRIPGPDTGALPTRLCQLDETSFALGYSDGSIKLYDIQHDKPTTTLHKARTDTDKVVTITAMASIFFMQQPFLCVVFDNKELRIYNAKTGTIIDSKSISEGVTCLCALRARAQFAIVTNDNMMQVMTYRGQQICTLGPPPVEEGQDPGASRITCLASSPGANDSQTCVVTGDSLGRLRVYK